MKTAALHRVRNYTIALALAAGTALLPQAASAGPIQDHGDFGGTWTEIAPSDHYHWRYAGRYYYGAPIYAAPGYAFGPTVYDPDFFGPPIYDDDEPDVALVAPDVGVVLDIDQRHDAGFMLIVGGTAALTAIAVYLAWHFLRRWLTTRRFRSAESHTATGHARRDAVSTREARELVP